MSTRTVVTTRRRIADLTLVDRLEDILTHDPVAHKVLGALLAASFLLPFGASDLTFEFALSLEVLGPVAVLLVLGLLLVLDCRNRAQDQVRVDREGCSTDGQQTNTKPHAICEDSCAGDENPSRELSLGTLPLHLLAADPRHAALYRWQRRLGRSMGLSGSLAPWYSLPTTFGPRTTGG